jgi:hypothetical protein
MNLQSRYDLECLDDVLNDDLDKSITPLVA